jgi:hypothetical protein
MMTRLHVPMLERIALASIAERSGESEEQALARIIRAAVLRELAEESARRGEVVSPCNSTALNAPSPDRAPA